MSWSLKYAKFTLPPLPADAVELADPLPLLVLGVGTMHLRKETCGGGGGGGCGESGVWQRR